jgi:hypothetical protein
MNNALEVLTYMHNWWHGAPGSAQRSATTVLTMGITFLYNNAHSEYARMTQESSRVAHVRSMFTVWKAVCARLPNYPFYDPNMDAVRAFPLYIETKLPDLFVQLIGQNVFLGVRFTEQERARHEQLRQRYVRPPPLKQSQMRPINQTRYPKG